MNDKNMLHNANKVAYLFQQFPKHSVPEIMALLQMPPIDVNAAMWLAQELGFITELDKKKDQIKFVKAPETWDFGPLESGLEDALTYCFKRLGQDEKDLDEQFLSDWTNGYPAHDVIIAMKRLLNDRVLFEYHLTDTDKDGTDNVYKFFTSFENSEMQWGKKNFKKAPKADGEK
jgi:hypothetical protein